MKTKYLVLLPVLALLAIAAAVVTPGKKTSEYPNIAVPDDLDMFLMARTNIAVPTNANHKYGQLFTRVTNVANTIATTVSNGVITEIITASNSVAGNSFARLEVQTNGVRLGLITNINWTYGMTGSVSSATAILGVDDSLANGAVSNGLLNIIVTTSNFLHSTLSLTGTTNFMNFSVQAAKLPATNYPGIDGGNQNWEVLYYHTNAESAVANLSAVWQFVVPPDYATNSGKLHVQHTLISTNGPNSSNVVWTVDCVRSHSGDGVNLHTASFGVQVHGTNVWAQSSTIIDAQTDLVINLDTNLMWQAGDLVLMRVTRNTANDTYRNTAVGLVGMQLEYQRQ